MRSTIWPLFPVLAVAFALTACRTFRPPEKPVVSLFPTVFPAAVLDACVPASISGTRLRGLLRSFGWTDVGVGSYEADLISRGLSRRGYAELDARRADIALRWLVFRVEQGDSPGPRLILKAAYSRRPPARHAPGVNAGSRPGETVPGRDPYGYPITITRWENPAIPGVAVRRIVCPSFPTSNRWEVVRTVELDPPGPG